MLPIDHDAQGTGAAPRHAFDPGFPSQRIDSHIHLWRYTPEEYGWIDDSMRGLRRDFLLPDLQAAMETAEVDGAIAVQARQTVNETEWLLQLATNADGALRGVTGWLPIAEKDWLVRYGEVVASPALKALRHVVQGEPAGFLDGRDFNAGIQQMQSTGLVYEILIYSHQLEEATRFVDRHPQQFFVLDHLAKPRIAAGETEPWAHCLRELARRPNVACKLSGMVTEADPAAWTPAQLKPYAEVTLEAFGADRLMIGSDWPVLLLRCEYARWWRLVEAWLAVLSVQEQALILGGNAARIYRLDEPIGSAQ